MTNETKPLTEVEQLEQRLLATTDPIEKQRLIRELVELTKKETRG